MKSQCQVLYCILLLLSLVVATAGCTSTQNVGSSFDREAIFQSYQTYAWYTPNAPRGEGVTQDAYNTELDQQIRLAIESGLVKEGMRPATTNPDIYIAYDIALETEPILPEGAIAPGFGFGYSYWYGYRFDYGFADFPGYRTIETYSPGTVIVDFIDATTNTLVWHGWADTAISSATVDSKKINRVVASIMAQYPPALSRAF